MFEQLDPPHTSANLELFTSGEVKIEVEMGCGGDADTHVVSVNDPLRCKHPHCGEFKVSRGGKVAYGKTPLLALVHLRQT